jgi:hypothetical protein
VSASEIIVTYQDAPPDPETAARAARNRDAHAREQEARKRAAAEAERIAATTAAELAAAGRELYRATTAALTDLATGYANCGTPKPISDLVELIRSGPPDDMLAETAPDQIAWHTLNAILHTDPERAHAIYGQIKQAARDELRTGTRAARAVEGATATPYERAQFAVILEAFRASYAPQHPAEDLMLQQMAISFEQYLRWQAIAANREEQGEWAAHRDRRILWDNMSERERDRYERDHGYLPPRISDAEAIDQAIANAERYLRSLRGLLRTYQMMRNRLGPVFVGGNAQLNVADRQVVLPAGSAAD